MGKRKWMLVPIGLALSSVVGLLLLRDGRHMPFGYYAQFPGYRRLPEEFVRRAFRLVSGFELPEQATELRAIFAGGRNPGMFLRFYTDSHGSELIVKKFSGPDVQSREFGPDGLPLHTGYDVFSIGSQWERRARVCVFDQTSTVSGHTLELTASPSRPVGYIVFLDDRPGIIYIWMQHI
jgi:hypothetical protein